MTDAQRFAVVIASLVLVLIALVLAAFVIRSTRDDVDIEARKIRFAAATFTGILVLFVFTALLYLVDDDGDRGQRIFEKAVTAMTPLAGVIVGYLFGSRPRKTQGKEVDSKTRASTGDAA